MIHASSTSELSPPSQNRWQALAHKVLNGSRIDRTEARAIL